MTHYDYKSLTIDTAIHGDSTATGGHTTRACLRNRLATFRRKMADTERGRFLERFPSLLRWFAISSRLGTCFGPFFHARTARPALILPMLMRLSAMTPKPTQSFIPS